MHKDPLVAKPRRTLTVESVFCSTAIQRRAVISGVTRHRPTRSEQIPKRSVGFVSATVRLGVTLVPVRLPILIAIFASLAMVCFVVVFFIAR